MKSTVYIFILLLITSILFSCEKIAIGKDEINSPENNFELLWNDFDKRYALFNVKQIDWNILYDTYRSQVSSETTNDELWITFTNLLDHLDDGHVILKDPVKDRYYESSGSKIDLAKEEFSLELIQTKYQEYNSKTSEIGLTFGKILNKDIGYIHLSDVEGDNPSTIDQVVADLKKHQAIIVDIRNNNGGDDDYAHRIAGAFADGEHFIYTVQTRNGIEHNDFDPKKKWFTRPEGNEQYVKPVILLTNRYVVSGAEIFTLNMKAFDHVTHIGDITAGDHSDQSLVRFLPNGWTYAYSTQLYLMPNGKSLEGIGIAPDIHIKNTKEDISARNDLVLEKAIKHLFDTYGIE
ncbi:peptidase S41-like protein [Aquimarina sp. MAR_2010_214]|uniref:S41 family peptidase n=1 Tax=Aquimarina sp. MAR_2010_214 TaxID=1250026 RepID=UPI000C711491|nr:S41 family peptidase [Aquimarina sp. MAR_2010_214]PKV50258.1 peptidase S41-like protein [Aquimarina sp. MAR_2010_214]